MLEVIPVREVALVVGGNPRAGGNPGAGGNLVVVISFHTCYLTTLGNK